MRQQSWQRWRVVTAKSLLLLGLWGLLQLPSSSPASARAIWIARPTSPAKPSANDTAVKPKLVAANNQFGFKLFQQTLRQDRGKNIFISPSSVAIALAMTYNGANGSTQEAMARTLELQGLSLTEINQANAALHKSLETADPEVKIAIANSLWANQGFTFKPEFIQRNQQFYQAKLTELNFRNPQATKIINNWVKQNTQGKIAQIVDRLDANQVLFLINAIYFKGNWTQAFNPRDTVIQPFTLGNGAKKSLPFMTQTGEYRYYENDAFQAVSLPYSQGRFSFYIFLPKANKDLSSFYQSLSAPAWEQWMSQFRNRPGSIQIPRFKLEYDIQLNEALKALGMEAAFDGSQADFSGMSADGNLVISEVKHKTFVEVNEVGTEAAAVTSVGIVRTAARIPEAPFKFVVDRPFFCTIRDNQTGAVLFMGSVVNP